MSLNSSTLLSLLAGRRSYYSLTSSCPLPPQKLKSILSQTLLTVPSAFNIQSTRLLLLLNTHHQKLWDLTLSALRPLTPSDKFPATESKLSGFRAAHGTILFYEDIPLVEQMKEKFPLYKDQFAAWTEQTSGMHQLAIWTALEAEGLGANLQHYNPVIDDGVRNEWGVNEGWILRGQMVFGAPEGERPKEKEKKPVEGRLVVFGDGEDGGRAK